VRSVRGGPLHAVPFCPGEKNHDPLAHLDPEEPFFSCFGNALLLNCSQWRGMKESWHEDIFEVSGAMRVCKNGDLVQKRRCLSPLSKTSNE